MELKKLHVYILMNTERSFERSTTDIVIPGYASSLCFTRNVCTEGGKECICEGECRGWGENVEGRGVLGGSPLNHSYGGTDGGAWGQPQGAVHTAAARLSWKRAMVGTE